MGLYQDIFHFQKIQDHNRKPDSNQGLKSEEGYWTVHIQVFESECSLSILVNNYDVSVALS